MRLILHFKNSQRLLVRTSNRLSTQKTCNSTRGDHLEMLSNVTPLEKFIENSKRYVKLEHEAEKERNKRLTSGHSIDQLCKLGVALSKLKFRSCKTNFDGRQIINFSTPASGRTSVVDTLKPSKLGIGDNVNLCSNTDPLVTIIDCGVISKIDNNTVTVIFDKLPDDWQPEATNFSLVQSVRTCTFNALSRTIDTLKKPSGFCHRLVEYMFGDRPFPEIPNTSSTSPNEHSENSDKVINFCLNEDRPICLVHGPPGTGKTTVLTKIVQQLVSQGKTILACAPSNVAVDNLMAKLKREGVYCARLGHPARVTDNLHTNCIDYLLNRSDQQEFIKAATKEIEYLNSPEGRKRMNFAQRDAERRRLINEIKRRRRLAKQNLVANKPVICCTLTLAWEVDNRNLHTLLAQKQRLFDCVIIDECAQATELACWAALLLGKRCILAGDHHQLPATIISQQAEKENLGRSLMYRLNEEFDKNFVQLNVSRILTKQFRMNSQIMQFASEMTYDNKLIADDSVANHVLKDLPNVVLAEETEKVLHLIDTSDCNFEEINFKDDQSKANINEVKLVYLHVKKLIELGLQQEQIAVISPYNLQVHFIRLCLNELFPNVAVGSVDGFQGQEREAVILSMVRSNDQGTIGFLADERRLNVAITRARRHLCLIGDCNHLKAKNNRYLSGLIDYFRKRSVIKSACEFQQELDDISLKIDFNHWDIDYSCTSKKGEKKKKKRKSDKILNACQQVNAISCTKSNLESEKAKFDLKLKNFLANFNANCSVDDDHHHQHHHHQQESSESTVEDDDDDDDKKNQCLLSKNPFGLNKNFDSSSEDLSTADSSSDVQCTVNVENSQTTIQTISISNVVDQSSDMSVSIQNVTMEQHGRNDVKTTVQDVSIKMPPATINVGPQKFVFDDVNSSQTNNKCHPTNNSTAQRQTKSLSTDVHVAKKTKTNKKTAKSTSNTELDENDFLEKCLAANQRCYYANCNKNFVYTKNICQYCKEAFCLQHCSPEAHCCQRDTVRQISKALASKPNSTPVNVKERWRQKLKTKVQILEQKRTGVKK